MHARDGRNLYSLRTYNCTSRFNPKQRKFATLHVPNLQVCHIVYDNTYYYWRWAVDSF